MRNLSGGSPMVRHYEPDFSVRPIFDAQGRVVATRSNPC